MNTRRHFIRILPLAGAGLLAGQAQAQAMVDEKDPTAASLGYVADANKSKNAKRVAGQNCAGCALFQAKAGAPAGGCAIFPGKQVAAKGWCTAFAKKP